VNNAVDFVRLDDSAWSVEEVTSVVAVAATVPSMKDDSALRVLIDGRATCGIIQDRKYCINVKRETHHIKVGRGLVTTHEVGR
jgi:hypothetical protein